MSDTAFSFLERRRENVITIISLQSSKPGVGNLFNRARHIFFQLFSSEKNLRFQTRAYNDRVVTFTVRIVAPRVFIFFSRKKSIKQPSWTRIHVRVSRAPEFFFSSTARTPLRVSTDPGGSTTNRPLWEAFRSKGKRV